VTEGEALRRAVVANPDDDLPRLVYADWLDEYGRALPDGESAADHAAFIRTQVEAAQAEPFGPPARAAAARAARLLKDHSLTWSRHVLGWVEEAEFVRGFVEEVAVEAVRLPAVADELFSAEPIRALKLIRAAVPAEWVSLEPAFEVPGLSRLAALDLSALGMLGLEYHALAESPHLEHLVTLSLRGNPVPPSWVTNFLSGPHLPHLTGLDLSDIPNLGPALAGALPRAAHRRLTRLDVSGVRFQSDELMRVLRSRALRDVEELRVGWGGSHTNPGPLAHLDLGWVIPWDRLRVLDLSGQGLGSEGVKEIARRPEGAGLRWLGLAANGLDTGGVAELTGSPHLLLYRLDVRNNELGPRDLAVLHQRFPEAEIVV
jgi:uncharacterized protein (TIGR02996 family)